MLHQVSNSRRACAGATIPRVNQNPTAGGLCVINEAIRHWPETDHVLAFVILCQKVQVDKGLWEEALYLLRTVHYMGDTMPMKRLLCITSLKSSSTCRIADS
eukprot:CAMPEP_0172785684 /NCGR_PEP_ID=MMETSP1074-20121228/205569_1 /TAXON_ID=2916 /ORGANISM="Ceratium fusus, Strain PA161109" /LENGTH=101 /DNA_ID=CAMNT_0013622695 /DNA_START=1953 /DNA_END=2258 /DNA_ORIENTATION=-